VAGDREQQTEQATPRRVSRARERGQVVLSSEILSVAVLLASGSTLFLVIGFGGDALQRLLRTTLDGLDKVGTGGPEGLGAASLRAAACFLPVALAGTASALAAGFSQTQGLCSFQSLKPDLNRLNPGPRLKNLVASKQAVITLLQQTGKVAVIVGLTWHLFWQQTQQLMELSGQPLVEIMRHLSSSLLRLGARVIGLLAVFAAIDYLLTRRRYYQELKMTKQEIKEEHREHEGDVDVKRRIRQRGREIIRKQMLAQVRRADVVVVNPTHFAVALRYDSARMPAPMVVAKGQDELAQHIRGLARSHQVPVVHNPPLARALYAEVRVGRVIPAQLYAAVAEVLAFVFRLRRRTA
jgi:flagellar biosynthesis protein FlhB